MKNLSYEAVVEGTKSMNILGVVISVLSILIITFMIYHFVCVLIKDPYPKMQKHLRLFVSGFAMLIVMNVVSIFSVIVMNSNWKYEKANPYINSLKVEKENVSKTYVVEENKIKNKDAISIYTKKTKDQVLPLVINFENKDRKELSGHYRIIKTLESGQTPYVEYQKLEKPLRVFTFLPKNVVREDLDGYKEGLYNIKLYVPKDYKLDF